MESKAEIVAMDGDGASRGGPVIALRHDRRLWCGLGRVTGGRMCTDGAETRCWLHLWSRRPDSWPWMATGRGGARRCSLWALIGGFGEASAGSPAAECALMEPKTDFDSTYGVESQNRRHGWRRAAPGCARRPGLVGRGRRCPPRARLESAWSFTDLRLTGAPRLVQ